RPSADLEPGGDRRARGDADRNAVEPGDFACRLERRLVADADDLVDQRLVEDAGNETGADALDLVRAGRAAREDGTVLGLDRDHPEAGLALLEHAAEPGERAAGADAADHHIDLAVGVLPDLLGGGL